ncbi:MAG: MYG1 family protein [Candidatus Yonathbacteria bacterium]|nr:MYG1 family protein [Candidatus Yonathbacteria bacterium]
MSEKNLGTNKKIVVTHSGQFHTDEVFACAVLSILNKGAVEVVRSRNPDVWATADYVVDVGGAYNTSRGLFDHHQIGGAGARPNGIPYSSFGLVWKEFGEKVSGSVYVARVIDERLVQPIDAGDNGIETFSLKGEVSPFLIQDVVAAFRPGWSEARNEDEGFFEIMPFAEKIITREIMRAHTEEEGKKHAEEAYAKALDKRIIILDDHYPWYEAIRTMPEPMFVVKPDRGGLGKWKIEAVRSDAHSFKNRKDLPRAWAGKTGVELAEVSGVPDALFCHNKLFVAVAGSKEGALKLAQLAVESSLRPAPPVASLPRAGRGGGANER